MSGRVRWERVHVGRGLGSTDVCGFVAGGAAFEAVRYDDTAPTYATHYDRDGAPDAEETFRRRSAAKRWLLARAAGLAEVPRGPSFGTRYGSPQTGVVVTCPSGGMYVPRGWRFAGGYMNVDGEMVVHLVRNRRRR